ncbi:hypothetical protein [Streptococcus ferus]|uniref:hypothetical protein n=1 Tax=Streptococcus ferus TaxID=1345 RepID=UPI0035A0B218
MAFVREVIPEEYWGMLKELGLYNKHTHLIPWVADKEREIYFWPLTFGDRDDPSVNDVLVWQGQVIYINTTTVDRSKHPTWNKDHTQLLKGLIQKDVNTIQIPPTLVGQEEELIQVIREVFQASDYRYDIVLNQIPVPEVREED